VPYSKGGAVDIAAPPGVEPWWWRLDPDLDYQEGIVPPPIPEPALRDCRCDPRQPLFVNEETGEIVRSRCKAPNLCSHCRVCSARETVEVLTWDAEDQLPAFYAVLTCRNFLTRQKLRRHLEHLRRQLRKVWPQLEWFVALEWQRRGAIHVNLIIKNVARSLLRAFRARLWRGWSRRVDAVPEAQYVAEIRNPLHAARYVAKLGQYLGKAEQSAPVGWRGHATSQTRGYFGTPIAYLRQLAKISLRWKAQRLAFRRAGCSRIEAAWKAADLVLGGICDWWLRCRPLSVTDVARSRVLAEKFARAQLAIDRERNEWLRQYKVAGLSGLELNAGLLREAQLEARDVEVDWEGGVELDESVDCGDDDVAQLVTEAGLGVDGVPLCGPEDDAVQTGDRRVDDFERVPVVDGDVPDHPDESRVRACWRAIARQGLFPDEQSRVDVRHGQLHLPFLGGAGRTGPRAP